MILVIKGLSKRQKIHHDLLQKWRGIKIVFEHTYLKVEIVVGNLLEK